MSNKKAPVAAAKGFQKAVQMTAEIPQDTSDFARKSVDQAQAAFEKVNDFAHDNVQLFDATAGAFKQSAAELQLKAIEVVQINTNAVFSHLRNLLSLKDANEVVALNQTFLTEQLQSFLRQASELNEMGLKVASETVKPVQDGMLRSFEEARKAFAA